MQRLGLNLHPEQLNRLQDIIDHDALAITHIDHAAEQDVHDDHLIAALADMLQGTYLEMMDIINQISQTL